MKNVLISGGSRGIGRAMVELFSKNGYKVAFLYKSNDDAANEVAKATGALTLKCDVSDSDEVRSAVNKVNEALGGIDILINNAGISQIKLFDTVSDEEFTNAVMTNYGGAFFLSREAAHGMIANKVGRIINVGSMWGKCGASCEVVYSSTKAALRGMTMSLAKELGPSGITVNCIEPGVIKTEMNERLGEEALAALAEETPLMRLGEAWEVAELALFLASDKAGFITGQCIGIDGGFAI